MHTELWFILDIFVAKVGHSDPSRSNFTSVIADHLKKISCWRLVSLLGKDTRAWFILNFFFAKFRHDNLTRLLNRYSCFPLSSVLLF